MCNCSKKCGCNITQITKGEKGDAGASFALPYNSYVALLTQSGEDDPVANILENTVGDIVWTRNSSGSYYGELVGAFLEAKTFVIGGSPDINAGGGDFATLDIRRFNDDKIILGTFDNFTVSDNLLVSTSIEIRVYN